jgi:hypothetical protein
MALKDEKWSVDEGGLDVRIPSGLVTVFLSTATQERSESHVARLIAAAPELAQALIWLLGDIEGQGYADTDTMEIARKTLKKAGVLP